MFIESLKEELNNEKQLTENGAVGYVTSGTKLLDLNFAVASLRNASENEVVTKFADAFYEEPLTAVKWLFFSRDVRGGLGERRLFRICVAWLANMRPEIVKAVIPLIPEYGRWDDLFVLLGLDNMRRQVIELIKDQLSVDKANMQQGNGVSLLAKWLPRPNTSSENTRRTARTIYTGLGMSEKEYRKTIVSLNSYLKTVEVAMSANRWDAIDYSSVPSKANLLYSNAFMKHDEVRRKEYLEALTKGEAKINSSVLFPHDIVHKYSIKITADATIEELWKALPDYVNGAGNTMVVADGSSSMTKTYRGTNIMASDVANSLAIYFAERSSGQFKDQYITFSSRPQLVSFENAKTLLEKIKIAKRHNEITNTNIEAVFDLILDTAVNKHMKQEELPSAILIISDMEFNCAYSGRMDVALFDELKDMYESAGYKLPRLVFWNVMSRTGTVPMQQNELGVALVSGFSPTIANMVLSGELDPLKCLLEQVNSERYLPIENAVKDII